MLRKFPTLSSRDALLLVAQASNFHDSLIKSQSFPPTTTPRCSSDVVRSPRAITTALSSTATLFRFRLFHSSDGCQAPWGINLISGTFAISFNLCAHTEAGEIKLFLLFSQATSQPFAKLAVLLMAFETSKQSLMRSRKSEFEVKQMGQTRIEYLSEIDSRKDRYNAKLPKVEDRPLICTR